MRFLKNLIQNGTGVLSGIKRYFTPSQRRVRELSPIQKLGALVAQQSYKHPNRLKTIPWSKGIWELDEELSSIHFCVYVNYQEKKVIFSVRGTQLSDMSDIAEDVKIIAQDLGQGNFARGSLRLKQAEALFKVIKNKYPNFSYLTASHSLGARTSKELARKYPELQAILFNTGGLDFFGNVGDYRRQNINDITSGTDIISFGSLVNPSTLVYNPNWRYFSHGIDAFVSRF